MPRVRVNTGGALVRPEGGGRLVQAKSGDEVNVSKAVADRLVADGAELLSAAGKPASDQSPAEPVLIEVDGQQVDLSAIEDADKLREIAGKIDGLEIAGNVKKVDTIRAKIVEHLDAAEAAGKPEDETGGDGGGDGDE